MAQQTTELTETVNEILNNAVEAAAVFSQLDQEQTDRIVRAVYMAALDNRMELAKMANKETGIGKWEDKVIKNVVATQLVYEDIKDLKTVGVINEDKEKGITEVAYPMGPILGVIPVTNPTSTVIFKTLIALKARNPIIFSAHPKAVGASNETARICYEAALSEDAPVNCVQWAKEVSTELTQALMRHPKLSLILATGGMGLVKEAYSSGTPSIGVGSGNVPVFIEKSADVPFAVDQIITSKTFDNGTVCASEQFLVVEKSIAKAVTDEFRRRKVFMLDEEDVKKIEKVVYDPKRQLMNADIVGRPATEIASKAGVIVPEDTLILIAPLKGVGPDYPLSREILAPILAFYIAEDFNHAVKQCIELSFFGGMGHTVSLFSNDPEKIKTFAHLMCAGRVIINQPSSQGGVGGIYNALHPSLTLGCGTTGHNITTDNISAKNLINIQRIAHRHLNERFMNMDKKLYFDKNIKTNELEKAYNRNY